MAQRYYNKLAAHNIGQHHIADIAAMAELRKDLNKSANLRHHMAAAGKVAYIGVAEDNNNTAAADIAAADIAAADNNMD